MAGRQADDAYVQASWLELLSEGARGVLASLVFILIEHQIDKAVRSLAELGPLCWA